MFGTLIESMAMPQRRAGGSAASLLAHAVLIGGAVVATAGSRPAPPPPPVDVGPVVFRVPAVVPPPESPQSRPVVEVANPAVPSLPALQVPTIIPSTIPSIDFAAPATPPVFSDRRSHETGDGCSGICGVHGTTSETPTWVGNDAMMQLRERVVPPRYPERLRQAGVEGRVVVRFVVDTFGRVDPATVEVVESTHELFTAEVREALTRLRFSPAMSGLRKLRVTAVMPFEFRIR
jgi:periplasmic protein TonB